MLEPLTNPKYLDCLLGRILKAKREIIAVQYLVELGDRKADPVERVAKALIDAKRRKVNVSVILEGSKFEGNYPFYNVLKSAGIDCWLDTSKTFIHQKACLVDGKYLISGSHNWTRASLEENKEFSILTDDKKAVKSFLQEYREIIGQRETIRKDVCREGVLLPVIFLKTVVAPLFRVHAGHLFDLYLIMYREDKGRAVPIKIDEKGWGTQLGFDPAKTGKDVAPEYKKYYFSQRMNRLLYQLQRFGFISIDRAKDTVKRRALPDAKDKITLPETYWRYGWDGRLSFAAKYFYLISLVETAGSPSYPWWRKNLEKLAKQYGCARPNIGAGARELANFNILERLISIPKERGGIYFEEPCHYRNNPFYDMKEFERRVEILNRKYSEARVEMCRKIALLFLKQYDIGILNSLCGLVVRYGKNRAAAAAKRMAKIDTSSSRRSFDYFEELVEKRVRANGPK